MYQDHGARHNNIVLKGKNFAPQSLFVNRVSSNENVTSLSLKINIYLNYFLYAMVRETRKR
jgi:hypothetical protein